MLTIDPARFIVSKKQENKQHLVLGVLLCFPSDQTKNQPQRIMAPGSIHFFLLHFLSCFGGIRNMHDQLT
ncbi:hypothetical protein SDC9_209658 [bioreactor metagenome]|uniref:Uncharacterized protein n=1 Tax=bioreactor metagenome TaxID=1076179 RepID=A0A645JFD9_9ZZZZ